MNVNPFTFSTDFKRMQVNGTNLLEIKPTTSRSGRSWKLEQNIRSAFATLKVVARFTFRFTPNLIDGTN